MDPQNAYLQQYQTSEDCISDSTIIENVTKYLVRFLNEGRRSNFPILSKINDTLAAKIWITACQFIDKQLENDRAVNITQLGTFSFSSKKLDVGNNKHIIVQRPVFLFSERLAQNHGITYTKHHVSGEIPVVKMNFTAIAIAMGSERDLVEGCIREILQALSRVIASREPIQFMFYNIGYLVVRDFRAKVKFTPAFVKRMDGTGHLSKLIMKKKEKQQKQSKKEAAERAQEVSVSSPRAVEPQKDSEEPCMARRELSKEKTSLPQIEEGKNDVTKKTSIPTAGIFSTSDLKFLPSTRSDSAAYRNASKSLDLDQQARVASARSMASSCTSINSTEARLKQFLAQSSSNVDILNNLSYVAYQRKMMNEERAARDNQADYVLQRFQDSKDRAVMKKEQQDAEEARIRAKKVAAFNVETSVTNIQTLEEMRDEKLGEQAKACIFQRRPLTPARFEKQENYSTALGGQVEKKMVKKLTETQEIAKNEKAEQTAIATEIQQMNKANYDSRRMNQKLYRKALGSQIRVKKKIEEESHKQEELAEPSSLMEPNIPYFGRNDVNSARRSEEKNRAKDLFRAQLDIAAEKRRKAIKKHLATQEAESQVLRRTKTDLIKESIDSYKNSVNRRRSLEQNWIKHAKEKRQREIDYQDFMKNDRFLHEKEAELHDKYAFMFKPKPCGYLTGGRFKSNIWRESRYIPGSRLIL